MESFCFVYAEHKKSFFLSWFDAINENLWIFHFLEKTKMEEEREMEMRGLWDGYVGNCWKFADGLRLDWVMRSEFDILRLCFREVIMFKVVIYRIC